MDRFPLSLENNLPLCENSSNFSEHYWHRLRTDLIRTVMKKDFERVMIFKSRFELQDLVHGFEAIRCHDLRASRKYIQDIHLAAAEPDHAG